MATDEISSDNVVSKLQMIILFKVGCEESF